MDGNIAMTSKVKRDARFLAQATKRAICRHEWRKVGQVGCVIFSVCHKCGDEDEKDVS